MPNLEVSSLTVSVLQGYAGQSGQTFAEVVGQAERFIQKKFFGLSLGLADSPPKEAKKNTQSGFPFIKEQA